MTGFEPDWIRAPAGTVPEAWIDYNGHMNLAYYVMAFDQGLDEILDRKLGAGPSFSKAHNQGPFALQNHVHYLGELLQGDQFQCRFLMLAGDAKRIHFAGEMHKVGDDDPVCVMEQVLINVDHAARRSVPYPQVIQDRIQSMVAAHAALPRPAQIGNYPATPLTEFNMTFFADEVVERCIGKNQPKSSWDRPEMSERRIAEFQKFGVTDCIET